MNATAQKITWPLDHPDNIKSRLEEACGWFELEAPSVPTDENGKISFDGPLTAFLRREGLNLDWIFCGDVESLARYFRDNKLQEKEFLSETRLNLTTGEQKGLIAALKMVVEEKLDIEECMKAWRAAVRQSRVG